MIENGSSDWYCTNCKAVYGLCSRAVLNGHKAPNEMVANCEFKMNVRSDQRMIMKMC